MPIAISDEHQELGATVRSLLASHGALAASRSLLEAATEARPSFWKEMAELGWLGIHLPEEHGGAGAGLSELVVVLDELGRQVAPGPFLPTVLASAVIAQCGNDEQRALLPGLADGSVVAALGLGGSLSLVGGVLDGDGGIVLGGAAADVLVLRAGPDLVVVERDVDGVTLGGTKNLDPSRRSATVTVSSLGVRGRDVLAGAARRARALARTLGAAEAVGLMAACTEAAVAYAKERVQFGRTIGTFQAVKHHCADMLVAAELATAAVWDAARASGDSAEEFDLAASMAAHLTFAPAVQNAQMNIQVHGGIGFTWEHDAHLFLRRALVLNALLGSPDDAEDVTALAARGTSREVSLDLPAEAEAIRAEVRVEAERIGALRGADQRKALVEAGLLVPHWPEPWGRAAGAVEQIVIDEELRSAGVKVPGLGITGWNIMTVNQYATPDQVERWVFKTLMGEYVWCQLFS
ncbi:MAG TPA: acyl-CoA dehydrogenase, partial [Myxococcaceae bacterium]